MKKVSTLFLKVVIVLSTIAVAALCIFVLPKGLLTTGWDGYRPVIVGMYLATIPFFVGTFNAVMLLNLIDQNKAFSKKSFKALNDIKYCAAAISGIYFLNLPFIFRAAEMDDAPGVMLLGLIFTFAPLSVAVIAALLQKMLKNAINIKSENEQII